jgi:hypothetical protein
MTVPANKKWTALFGVWALHGAFALLQFLSLPSDGGLSLQRALMSVALFAWIIFNLVLIVSMLRESRWLLNLLEFIKKPNIKDSIFIISSAAVLARIWITLARGLFEAAGNFKYSAYAERLDPFLGLMTFILLEIIAVILFFVFRNWNDPKNDVRVFTKRISIILFILALASLFVYVTGWGVIPGYKGDWSRGIPAVALMEWQIILACLFCIGMVVLESKHKGLKKNDLWICVAVWLLAVGLWLGQPVNPSSSALAPRAPNFETYPFNDAQIYDSYAQSAMIGAGYGDHIIPQRPLYIVALIWMHVLVGQNYDSVIILQSLLLAFFPVLLYLFGKEFFGRPIGVAIALLAILRDITSNIAAPFTGNLSYSKLYLSEIPTAMMLILFLLIGMRWIKSGFPLFSGFMLGGILGVGILIRTQVVVAFPVLIFFALLTRPKLFLPALKSAALGVLAIAIVVAPWFARNWQMTGQLIFDNPASQTANLALRYSRVNGHTADITQLPGESNSEYNDRMMRIAKESLKKNPFAIGKEIASAFINHGVNNILLFPLRYEMESLGEFWSPANAFWQQWRGAIYPFQILLLGFYIFLFGLGVAVAWQRIGWLGFLPLGVNLAYNLWTSIALLSGQRFMLTMDWSAYLYYMIGLFVLLSIFLFTLERSRGLIREWYAENQFAFIEFVDHTKLRQYLFAGIFFFIVGASLWAVEMMFPQRYPLAGQDEMVNKIISSSSFDLDAACFRKTISENDLKIAQGRALYPRYYEARDGEDFTDAVGYKAVDQNRIVFEMIGQVNNRVVFPVSKFTDFFPNASDVTLGVDQAGKPWFALVEWGNTQRFYLSDFFDNSVCK